MDTVSKRSTPGRRRFCAALALTIRGSIELTPRQPGWLTFRDARVSGDVVNRGPAADACEMSLDSTDGFLLALLAIAIVVAWVIAKVRYYAKQSERQWRAVDKSKLKRFDDDDWDSA